MTFLKGMFACAIDYSLICWDSLPENSNGKKFKGTGSYSPNLRATVGFPIMLAGLFFTLRQGYT